jgi:tetratricopeptide (TPR) repeat protein
VASRMLDPIQIPDGFWDRDTVLAALDSRDIGALFRLLRQHTGASQTRIGIAVGMPQSQVSVIMSCGPRRRQVIAHEVFARIADGLQMPDRARQRLGLAPAIDAASGRRPPTDLVPSDHGTASEMTDVRRRTFLAGTGVAAFGALAPPAVRAWGVSPTELSLATTVTGLATAMLTPAARGNGEPLDLADLTTQVHTAWRLRQRASYEALGQLLPTLIGQAETSSAVLADADQDQARRIVVHTYNAASSLLRKLGDKQLALLAADRAVRCAHQTGDPVLIAAAMYRLANVLLSAGRLEETKAVALDAANLTEPGKLHTPRSLSMWGGLLLTAAVASARRGDESSAWELMDEARAGSRLLAADHADIYSIFGPTNVAIHGVQVAVELHNGSDAVRRSRAVNPDGLPASLIERRGQFLIDVASGHVLQGDDADAVATLLHADRNAPQEVRLSTDVHRLVHIMLGRERTGAAPGLRDLAGRIGLSD